MADPRHENLHALAARACDEISEVFGRVHPGALDEAAGEIRAARRIALHGVGREGLMMRALAMRLYHLGLDAHPVGDMTTPPLGAGDLLVASAGPGYFATVAALLEVAREAGARTLLLSAQAQPVLASRSDCLIVLPARTMAQAGAADDAVLPMGSAYEGCQYVFFELLVRRLRQLLPADESAMRARHTNLE
jgi:6-phospho-3-hexuloisomerase